MLAEDLHHRDALLGERAHARSLPGRAPAEALLRRIANARGVDAAVLVRDVDAGGTGAVGGLCDADGEVAVGKARAHEQRVAAPERDAPAHDQLGVAAKLLRRHRPPHRPPS